MGNTTVKAPDLLPELPPELQLAVLSRLPPNEVALSARRTCRAAAQHFAEEHHRTAAIGQPLPPHAASEPMEGVAEAAMHHLSFRNKLRTLSVAAATGNVANLEVAWRLLQPCIFPELLQTAFYPEQLQGDYSAVDNAGAAAAKGGSIHAVAWLLDRCPGLVNRSRTLEAAAKHFPLPQLQEAWRLLRSADGGSLRLDSAVLCAAAESRTPDAIGKMEWVLDQGQCFITSHTATAAARSGDLARLRWLRGRGWQCDNWGVLEAALRHADLAVADWLVDQAGCPLPDVHRSYEVVSAAAASGSVDKLRWLQARGVPLYYAERNHGKVMAAAGLGNNTEVVRFLLELEDGGELLSENAMGGVLSSGNVAAAAFLLGPKVKVQRSACRTWRCAGCKGGLAMLRWLVEEAHMSASDVTPFGVIPAWPSTPATDSRQLLAAVRLLQAARLQQQQQQQQEPADELPDEDELSDEAELLPEEAELWEETELPRDAILHAARRGDLGLLRYLHEELGASLGPHVLAAAVHSGCGALLEWLVERGCAAGREVVETDACYLAAGKRGDRGTLECLRRLGVPRSEVLWLKASKGVVPEPVFQWIRAAGHAGV